MQIECYAGLSFFGSRCYTSLVANAYSAAFFVPYRLFFCCPAESNLTAESKWVAWPWLTVQHYGPHPSGHWPLWFFQGPTGRIARHGVAPREVGGAVSFRFPSFSKCGSVDKNDFLRFPPFSSVLLRFPLFLFTPFARRFPRQRQMGWWARPFALSQLFAIRIRDC